MARIDLLTILRTYSRFGFHVSRKSWDWLDLPELAVAPPAGKPAAEIFQLRRLADRVNQRRPDVSTGTDAVHGGELASVSLIVDVFRYITESYCQGEHPGIIGRGLDQTGKQYGEPTVQQPPPTFVRLFPPLPVLQGKQTDSEYARQARSMPVLSDTVVREIILVFLSGANPASHLIRFCSMTKT